MCLLARRVVADLHCPEDHIKCKTQKRGVRGGLAEHCVAPAFTCDGFSDCYNGQDEVNCRGSCKGGARECDGRCILAAYWCDGERDCQDGADESLCPQGLPDDRDLAECLARGRPATTIKRRGVLWCDGRNDCKSGTDERSCKKPTLCRGAATHCLGVGGQARCVHPGARCDGYPDCEDGSDESGCAEDTSGTTLTVPTKLTTPSAVSTPPRRVRPLGSGRVRTRPPSTTPPAVVEPAGPPSVQPTQPVQLQVDQAPPVTPASTPWKAPNPGSGGLQVAQDDLPVYAWLVILALVKIILGLAYFSVRQWCSSRRGEDDRQGVEKAVSFVYVGSSAEQAANSQHRPQNLVPVQEDNDVMDLLTPCVVPVEQPTQPPPRPTPLQPQRSLSGEHVYESLRTATRPGVDLLLATLEDVVNVAERRIHV